MRKQDFIKMVMENPAPVMGMLACYGGRARGMDKYSMQERRLY